MPDDDDTEPDEQGGCEPAIPTELRPPIVAAWDAGQRFNVLAFQLEQDWLLFGGQGQQERVAAAFEEFVIAAREVLTSGADQDRLRDELFEWYEEWRNYIRSERHAERFMQTLDDIEIQLCAGEATSVEAICRDVGMTIDFEIDRLRKLLEERLDETQSEVCRLAELIDQLVRPRQIYREMFAAAEAKSCFPNWRLRAVDVIARTPTRLQLTLIAQAWNRLGFRVDELEPMIGVEPRVLAKRLCDAGRKALIASDPEPEVGKEPFSPPGDAAVSGNQEPPPVDRPPPRSGPLKLLLYDRHWKVGREGNEATVQLTDLEWELLAKLVAEYDAPAGFEKLRLVWEQAGNAKKPSKGTVRGQVSDLSNKLKPLGVAIKNLRKRGWKLFDPREPATTEEGNSAAQDA